MLLKNFKLDETLKSSVESVNDIIDNVCVEDFGYEIDDISCRVSENISEIEDAIKQLDSQEEYLNEMVEYIKRIRQHIINQIEKLQTIKDALEYVSSNLIDASSYQEDAYYNDVEKIIFEESNDEEETDDKVELDDIDWEKK